MKHLVPIDPPAIAPRVVLIVEGGLVSHVLADAPVDVLVLDYDTQGTTEAENIVQVPQIDGTNEGHTEPAMFLDFTPVHAPEVVHQLFNLQHPCPPAPETASNATSAA